jgi:HK97 family phage major capsid protein
VRQVPVPALPRQVRDQLSFLNLIPIGTTDGNSVPYTQKTPITGTDPSPARETAEGDLKPEGTWIDYIDAEAPVRTIAVWLKTRKQVLSDIPALRSTMDTRLRYMVQKRLAEEVLNGNGSGVNLRGILQTSGIGQVNYNASIPASENILSGITNVYLNDGVADGIVVNPIDWMSVVTAKYQNGPGNAGSFEYVGGGPFGNTPANLWGVPVIPSQVMSRGDSLVADFGLGAQLLIREGLQVLFSDSDQDDFLRNRITMLAEMRAALLVWRPSLFQKVRLAA